MAITLGNVFLLDTGIAGFIALLITLAIIDLVLRDPAAKPPEEMANALGISLFFWGGRKSRSEQCLCGGEQTEFIFSGYYF